MADRAGDPVVADRIVLRAGSPELDDLLDDLDAATDSRIEQDQRPLIVRHVSQYVVWVDDDDEGLTDEELAKSWESEPYDLVAKGDQPFDAYIDVEPAGGFWPFVYDTEAGPAYRCPDCAVLAGPDQPRDYMHRGDCARVSLVAVTR